MDKVLALVVTASILLVAALIVITMTTGSLGDLNEGTDTLQNEGCKFEIQQLQEEGSVESEDVSTDCQDYYNEEYG